MEGELKNITLGPAHLKVADLDRAIPFYENVIGFQVQSRDDGIARLGAGGPDLVVLHERPGALPVSRHSGLYHVAILYPSQLELARVLQRILATDTPIQGASDHGTHEAVYLPDPDGNGLELAADRPRAEWPDLSDITAIAPQPLDMGGLFNLVAGRDPVPEADPETKVGHLHLHVGDLDDARAFYGDALGLDVKTQIDTALFLSADGYHHHLGLNTWQGRGAPPAPDTATGLGHWTIELSSPDDVAATRARLGAAGHETGDIEKGFESRDPSGNAVHVISG
jgi:catechol 2,3-dioxygenase